MGSRAFFPLLSNSRSLVQGAPIAAMRRRLKVASIVHDEVLLEAASVAAYTHPVVNWITAGMGREQSWQTSRERREAVGKTITLAPDNPDLRLDLEILSAWHATLEP